MMNSRILAACGLCLLLGCYPEEPGPTDVQNEETLLHKTLLPPSSLHILTGSSTHVHLRWQDESIRETGYVLEMSQDGNDFVPMATVSADVDTLTLFRQFSEASTYLFRMRTSRNEVTSEPTSSVMLFHNEEYYFLKYRRANGVLFDGVYRSSQGQSSLVLSSTVQNSHLFNDLGFFGDSLVVIGPFFSVGGFNANRAAVWDGSSWSRFGDGILDPSPISLVSTPSDLYVGSAYAPFVQSYIYRWSGSAFAPLVSTRLNSGGRIIGGSTFQGNTYFIFDVAEEDDPNQSPLAVVGFQGANLLPIPQPPEPYLRYYRQTGIAGHTDGLYISLARIDNPAGHTEDTTLIRYDESSWSVAAISPQREVLTFLTSWRTDLFSIRSVLDSVGREIQSEIRRWTGSTWETFRSDGSAYFGLWDTPNGLVAGSIEATTNASVLLKWDGSGWLELDRSTDGFSQRKVSSKPAWGWRNGP